MKSAWPPEVKMLNPSKEKKDLKSKKRFDTGILN